MHRKEAGHRPGLSARLNSLFSDGDNKSTANHSQEDTTTMAPRATATRLSFAQSSRPSRSSAPASPLSRLQALENQSSMSSTEYVSSQQGPFPFLRWFSTRSTPDHSRPPSPSSALSEALNEDIKLPSRPEAALLPQSFHPGSHSHVCPPPILNTLTRSTLPTASLSFPDQSLQRPGHAAGHYTVDSAYPVILNGSPPSVPSRSSLDTLRTLHSRSSSLKRASSSNPLQHQQRRSINISGPIRSWFQNEAPNDKQHESILDEEDQGESSDQERERIRHKYLSPKNPIVFCHGLLGFDSVTIGPSIAPIEVTHWRGIKEVLEANGSEVLITRVPATSSPIDRAKVLVDRISEVYPGRKVHLIGHSMGGLDCRYMTTHLTDRNFSVLSITTVATPHRGSTFADHFLATVGQSRMPQVLSLLDLLPNGGGDGKAFEFLTTENMKKFNLDTPDLEGVNYFSYGAVYDPGLIDTWKYPHSVVLEKEGPNDGLVSVMSSRWGTYLGTLENVSHLDLVGWINTARYKWAEFMGREIKFKPATFYLGIADHLAKAVEGLSPGEHGDQDKDQLERREEPEPAKTIHAQEENAIRSKHEGNGQEFKQPAVSERTDGEDDQDCSTSGKS